MSFTAAWICLVQESIDQLLPCWVAVVALTLLLQASSLSPVSSRAETPLQLCGLDFGEVRLIMDLAFILLIYGIYVCLLFPR